VSTFVHVKTYIVCDNRWTAARAQGRDTTPSLGWLIGATMPISPAVRRGPAPPEDQEMHGDTDDYSDDDTDDDSDDDLDFLMR
jgi:hypothetical protein